MNNFDLVRLALALVVLISHVSVLSHSPELRPLKEVFDSNFAVRGFFAISGFLICRSYCASTSIKEYAFKRFLRIYPAYTLAIIACFTLGLTVSKLPFFDFITHAQTLRYIIANLLFLNFLQPTLPGVFEDQTISALNGSLWTIKVEISLYAALPILLLILKKTGFYVGSILIIIPPLLWTYYFMFVSNTPSGVELARQMPGQIPYFFVGALYSIYTPTKEKIQGIALLSCILLFLVNDPSYKIFIDPLAYSSLVIFFCTSAANTIKFSYVGDLSYGIYLFHFPIIQAFVHAGSFTKHPWLATTGVIGVTIVLAALSWKFVEKPLLLRRRAPGVSAISKRKNTNRSTGLEHG